MKQVKPKSAAVYIAVKTSVIFFFLMALLSGCSFSGNHNKQEAFEDGYKTFVFYDKVDDWDSDNAKINKWKVVFKDDEIYRLYKNDKRIPDNEIDEYEDLVYDNLPGSHNNARAFTPGNSDSFNFKFWNDGKPFDKEKFRKKMEELKKELKKMKRDKLNFDDDAFREQMENLDEQLDEMRINIPRVDIDMEAIHEEIERASEDIRNQQYALNNMNINIPPINIPEINIPEIPAINIPEINIPEINIDMPEFEHNMKHFDESMSGLNESMDKLDHEMKKLDAFMDDFTDELVKQGIIKSKKQEVRIEYDKGVLEINGKKAPDDLTKKYKELYKKHFGKEPDEHSSYNY